MVCHVERDAYAASVLVARMEDAALDQAPIWDDLTTFDGRPWRGLVDCVTAGIPCQPYSLAGKGAGHRDERALWPELVRIVRECEPQLVFIENVAYFLKFFEPVWRELRAMDFVFAPPLLQSATFAGAPHLRKRLFVLAAHSGRSRSQEGQQRWSEAGGSAESERLHIGSADSDRQRCEGEWSGWVFNIERQTLRHDPDGCGDRCRICGSHWEAESPPIRMDAGFPERMDQLRAVGNSVVPDVAASAWTYLRGLLP